MSILLEEPLKWDTEQVTEIYQDLAYRNGENRKIDGSSILQMGSDLFRQIGRSVLPVVHLLNPFSSMGLGSRCILFFSSTLRIVFNTFAFLNSAIASVLRISSKTREIGLRMILEQKKIEMRWDRWETTLDPDTTFADGTGIPIAVNVHSWLFPRIFPEAKWAIKQGEPEPQNPIFRARNEPLEENNEGVQDNPDGAVFQPLLQEEGLPEGHPDLIEQLPLEEGAVAN